MAMRPKYSAKQNHFSFLVDGHARITNDFFNEFCFKDKLSGKICAQWTEGTTDDHFST